MKIIWLKKADQDLEEILDFISIENPAAAKKVYKLLKQKVAFLSELPMMGRSGRVLETWELVITGTPYVVAYTIYEKQIHILRILHSAREWPKSF